MEKLLEYAPSFLNYGAIGLSLLLAVLSYRLIREIIPKIIETGQNPPKIVRSLILSFMFLCLMFFSGGTILEVYKYENSKENMGWGTLQGQIAQASFVTGGSARKLNGEWRAVWWKIEEDGSEKRYEIEDPLTGEMIDYPEEKIFIVTRGSVVSCNTDYSSGENIDYWYEGRISSGNHITLLYWTPPEGAGSKNVGVVFLEMEEVLNKPLKLKGSWQGRTRNGKITTGRTEWIKKS